AVEPRAEQPPRVQVAPLRERDRLLGDRANLLRLRQRRADALVAQELRHQPAVEGKTFSGRAAEAAAVLAMAHVWSSLAVAASLAASAPAARRARLLLFLFVALDVFVAEVVGVLGDLLFLLLLDDRLRRRPGSRPHSAGRGGAGEVFDLLVVGD